MELNGDGKLAILSGSYSRHDPDMAGLFQVLRRNGDGSWRTAEVLNGSDGKPLIITNASKDRADVSKICTRPFACDLDGDGKLDLVSGNFGGTFAFFRGEGGGKFAPTSTWLQAGGKAMHVEHHSDPFLVDWDGDGDLDLLSGSANGGVVLFVNGGSRTEPAFQAALTLVPPPERQRSGDRFGDAHLQGPQGSTRVWADDVDGDGKLDLLVGDCITVVDAVAGVEEAAARKGMRDCDERLQKLYEAGSNDDGTPKSKDAEEQRRKAIEAIGREREKFVKESMTGFVWLLRRV